MKVCLINTNREWGGGEKWHFHTAVQLRKAGYDVVAMTFPESPLAQALKGQVRVEEFRIGNLSFLNYFLFKRLTRFFNTEAFDAIIMNLPRDVKAFSKPAAHAGIQKIIYRRGMNHPIKSSRVNKYFYKRFVTDIVANSEAVCRSVYQNIPELKQKITIIPNGVKIKDEHKKSPPRSRKILIGNLGRLVEQKGQFDLIKLGEYFLSKEIAFHVFIGGEGPLHTELQDEIQKRDLENHFTLLGQVKPTEFFPKIDYFVFPSRFEGLSNAMLEALQYGKPILCYDVASNAEIVVHGKNGYLVKPYQIEKIGEHLIELHQSPEKYREMQKAGEAVLCDKYDSDKLFRKLENLLKSKS